MDMEVAQHSAVDVTVEEASAPTAGTPTAIAWATASAHPRAHDAVARRPRSARSRALHGARASRSRPARSAHARTPRCAPGSWNIAEPVVIQVYITCTYEMNTIAGSSISILQKSAMNCLKEQAHGDFS